MLRQLTKICTICGLSFAALCACEPQEVAVSIPFAAHIGGQALDCQASQPQFRMTDLRFYVYQPRLHRSDGTSVSIRLTENGRWQKNDLVLIDLEDGSGDCRNGTVDSNNRILGKVPAGDYRRLSFSVGVPFDLNHADPLSASVPLDDSTMHWHWRSGFKFLRAGFITPTDGFWIHLGSAGCQGTVQNIAGCRFSNRFDVLLDDYHPGNEVAIDFAKLYANSKSDDGLPSSCSSGPAENPCREAFSVFGIDFDTGEQVSEQQFFSVSQH